MISGDLLLKLVYAANVIVAGCVGALSLLRPQLASRVVWENAAPPSIAMQMTGALWSAIAVLSFAGLFFPEAFVAVLVLQVIYKGGWLLVVALPAVQSGNIETIPRSMTWFFVAWVIILPFVIPWQTIFPRVP